MGLSGAVFHDPTSQSNATSNAPTGLPVVSNANIGLRIVESPPACRKTLRAGKITTIVSFKRAKLTVYIYRDNNKLLSDLL